MKSGMFSQNKWLLKIPILLGNPLYNSSNRGFGRCSIFRTSEIVFQTGARLQLDHNRFIRETTSHIKRTMDHPHMLPSMKYLPTFGLNI